MNPITSLLDQAVVTITAALTHARSTLGSGVHDDPERGSITLEQVLWATFVVAIVALATAALGGFITAQFAKLA